MNQFEGFSPKTNEVLLGIRFNNNKEWFDAHKDEYNAYVHKPMILFAEALYNKMCRLDKDFDALPKVCRVYRDTRFTKNKERYKDSKWFFLRADGQSGIHHEKPTIFFEISPEFCNYGFGYWSNAKGMAKIIQMVKANPAEAERMIALYRSQNVFALEGEYYKRNRIDKEKVSMGVYDWCMRKSLTFLHKINEENVLFEKELVDNVFSNLAHIYPLYCYFMQISKMD